MRTVARNIADWIGRLGEVWVEGQVAQLSRRGGAATVFGPVLGTILFFSVRILIRGVTGAIAPPELLNTQQSDQFSWVVVGVILMLLVIFRPQGILGNKRELQFNA